MVKINIDLMGEEVKKAYELLEKEKKLIIQDFQRVKKIEKEENIEEKALKHFEEKLGQLIKDITYLEGYIFEIQEGNDVLRHHKSVQVLEKQLSESIAEIEELAKSLIEEEEKIMVLAKHVKTVLDKAKKYQGLLKRGR